MKKSLLLMLFLALTWCWTGVGAQTPVDVEIGELASAENDSYLPMNSLYEYSYTQQIYTADEIGMAGTINSITVWLVGAADLYEMPFDIYMVHTDKMSFASNTDWVAVSAADIVYSGNITVHNTDAEAYTFILSTPFDYDGSSNLIIAFNNTTGQWKSGLNGKVFTATDNADRALYARQDGSAYDPTNMASVSAYGKGAKRNVIKFNITPSGSICNKPSSLVASDVTAHGVTLTWADGSGSYNVEYKKAADEEWTSALANTALLTTSLSNLDAATNYQARVQSICGSETSGWKTVSFTTLCGVVSTFPWSENFDGVAGVTSGGTNNLPICWNYINTSTSSNYKGYPVVYGGSSYYASYAHSGNNHLRFYSYYSSSSSSSDPQPQYAILPEMQGLQGLRVKLYARANYTSATYDATFKVGVMNDPADASTFSEIQSITPSSTSYELYTIPLDQAPFSDGYIAIMIDAADSEIGTSSYSYRSVYIDDIVVELIPSCLEPAGLAVSSDADAIGPNSIKLVFTAGDSHETAWKLQYKKSADSEWINYPSAVTSPFVLSDLNASTQYDIRIAAWCTPSDPDGISGYTEPIQVATACEAITAFPVSYNFETSEGFPSNASTPTTNQLGACWRNEATLQNGSNSTRVWGTSTTYKHEGSQALILPDKGNSTNFAKTMLVFPEMLFTSESGYTVSFWIYRNGTSTNPEGFKVYISDTDTISPNAVELGHYSRNYGIAYPVTESASGWYQYEIAIPKSTMTGNVFLIFEGQSYYGSATYVDEIVIEPTPTCKKPKALASSEIKNHSVKLSWTENGEATAWKVAYKTIDQTGYSVVDANENPYVLSGLLADTTYFVKVLANCGDAVSDSSAVISFTTAIACAAIDGLSSSEISSSSAKLTWNEGECESYDIRYGVLTETVSANYDFEGGSMPAELTTTTASYPWTVVANTHSGAYCAKSGNAGESYSTSDMVLEVTLTDAATLSFSAKISSESGYDKGYFSIDGTAKSDINGISGAGSWIDYSYPLSAGKHTLRWYYYKDSSGDDGDDCFYVDDIKIVASSISDWSVISNLTDTLYTLDNLSPTTKYAVQVRANCGSEDGVSAWSNSISFTTLASCAVPFNVAASEVTAYGAKIAWEGNSDSYKVLVDKVLVDVIESYDFEGGSMPSSFSKSATYGFEIVSNKAQKDIYCVKSGNAGVNSSTADMVLEINLTEAATLTFLAKISSESGYDKGYFSIDGTDQSDINGISGVGSWIDYSYPLSAGTHTLRWRYTKDSSTAANDDCFYVDDIVISNSSIIPVKSYTASVSPLIIDDAANIEPETPYVVTVKGVCGSIETEASAAVSFTTLPSCLPVSDFAVSNVTATSADLSWINGATSQDAWQICLNGDETTLIDVTDNPFTLTGLADGTNYSVKVRANCSADDKSDWSSEVLFATIQLPAALPYNDDFESGNKWLLINGDIVNAWVVDTAAYNGGKKALYISNDGGETNAYTNNAAAMVYATKLFNFEAGKYVFSYDWKAYGESTYDYLRVALVPDAEALSAGTSVPSGFSTSGLPTGWIALDGGSKLNLKSDWQKKEVVIEVPAAGAYKMVFGWRDDTSSGSNPPAAVDNVHIYKVDSIYVNASRYATFYTENYAYVMPEGLTGYAFTVANNLSDVVYEAADTVPANAALVLESQKGDTTYWPVPTFVDVQDMSVTNELIGVNEATIVADEDGYQFFVLSMNGSSDPNSVGFYWMLDGGAGGFTMPAHKAYLKVLATDLPAGAPAGFFLFNDENGATRLNSLEGVEGTVKFLHEGKIYILREGVIYDATGRQVRKL